MMYLPNLVKNSPPLYAAGRNTNEKHKQHNKDKKRFCIIQTL